MCTVAEASSLKITAAACERGGSLRKRQRPADSDGEDAANAESSKVKVEEKAEKMANDIREGRTVAKNGSRVIDLLTVVSCC